MTPSEPLSANTVWDLLLRRAAATPAAPLAIDAATGQQLNVQEAVTMAERMAASFVALGIRPGGVVTWQLPTSLISFITSLALARLNCQVHFMRRALAYANKTQRRMVSAAIATVFAQETPGRTPAVARHR